MTNPLLRWPILAAVPVLLLGLARVDAQTEGPPANSSEDEQAAEAPNDPPPVAGGQRMTNGRLSDLLAKHFADFEIEGGNGVWRIELPGLADDGPPAREAGPAPGREGGADDGGPNDGGPNDGGPNDGGPNNDRSNDGDPDGNGPDDGAPDNEPPDDKDQPVEEQPDDEAEGGPGAGNRLPAVVLVLTDQRANRMRIMIPIRPFDPGRAEDLRLALIALHANYDRALDARYAVQDGVLWSVFIHPLGSLTADDLENALKQVITLRRNTGTTFSSSDMLFGGPAPEPEELGDDVI